MENYKLPKKSRCICGGNKNKIVFDGWEGSWNLVCLICQTAASIGNTKEQAINNWNFLIELKGFNKE